MRCRRNFLSCYNFSITMTEEKEKKQRRRMRKMRKNKKKAEEGV